MQLYTFGSTHTHTHKFSSSFYLLCSARHANNKVPGVRYDEEQQLLLLLLEPKKILLTTINTVGALVHAGGLHCVEMMCNRQQSYHTHTHTHKDSKWNKLHHACLPSLLLLILRNAVFSSHSCCTHIKHEYYWCTTNCICILCIFFFFLPFTFILPIPTCVFVVLCTISKRLDKVFLIAFCLSEDFYAGINIQICIRNIHIIYSNCVMRQREYDELCSRDTALTQLV